MASIKINENGSPILRSPKLYRICFEKANDAIFLETLDGRIIDVNPRACEMLGYSYEELAGQKLDRIVPPEMIVQMPGLIEKLKTDKNFKIDTENIHRDRTRIPVEVSASIIEIEGHQLALTIVRDISKRVQTEVKLRSSEKRYRILSDDYYNLIKLSPIPTHLTSLEGNVLMANEAWYELIGRTPEEVRGRNIIELGIYAGGVEARKKLIKELMEHEVVKDYEVEYRNARTDQVLTVLGNFQLILFRNRKVFQGFGIDITQRVETEERKKRELAEQKRLSKELERLNSELSSLNKMKDTVVSNITHDLKSPLATVRGYNQLIMEGKLGDVSSEVQRVLAVCLKNIDRLNTMIQNILVYTKLETGGWESRFETLDLESIINELFREYPPPEENLRVRFDPPAQRITTMSDHNLIYHLLGNLLSNAYKFSPEGGTITITLGKKDDEICISITDTGLGIPEEDREKIFERFYKIDKPGGYKTRGTGLGLAIVKEITKIHKGRITLESEVGEGSTFRIYLPVA